MPAGHFKPVSTRIPTVSLIPSKTCNHVGASTEISHCLCGKECTTAKSSRNLNVLFFRICMDVLLLTEYEIYTLHLKSYNVKHLNADTSMFCWLESWEG